MGKGKSGNGGSLPKGGSGRPINIKNEEDVWSYRHNKNNAPFVDEINQGMLTIEDDFPGFMKDVNTVSAAELGGADKYQILGYYDPAAGGVALNTNFTDINKMNTVFDNDKEGFHPSRGNKTGTQAVALHEGGHALNDHIAKKLGMDLDTAAAKIVKDAYKESGARGGNLKWAGGISKYAQKNYAECIAEAVADWYCNGNKASSASKAIMKQLNKYK